MLGEQPIPTAAPSSSAPSTNNPPQQEVRETVLHQGHEFQSTGLFEPQFKFSNTLSELEVMDFKTRGLIPESANIIVPSDSRISADYYLPGWFAIHAHPFTIGLEMPFPPLVEPLIKKTGMVPAQFNCSGWQVLMGVERLYAYHDIPLTLCDLGFQYAMRTCTQCRLLFRSRRISTDLILKAESGKGNPWQSRFFFVEKSSLGPWADYIPELRAGEYSLSLVI